MCALVVEESDAVRERISRPREIGVAAEKLGLQRARGGRDEAQPAGIPKLDPISSVPTEIIGGLPIAAIDRRSTARLMVESALAAKRLDGLPYFFSSANGQVLSALARARDPAHPAKLVQRADVISADGQPLVFASRLLGRGGVRERCATTDLFHDVARIAAAKGITFFLLGASPEENRKAAENVARTYPSLKVVGRRHGYFDTPADERAAVENIASLQPDILWVAMGVPREQEFCMRWRTALRGVGVMKTSGGLFNFLSGSRPRAPRWLQLAGLEWAYRTALEPRRLFARYATTNLHAGWLLLTQTEGRRSAEAGRSG